MHASLAAAVRIATPRSRYFAEPKIQTEDPETLRCFPGQSRPDDFTNLNGASTAAVAAVLNGSQPGDYRWADPSKDFAWIATDNSLLPLDAVGMIALGSAAMANRSRLIFVASGIKARIRAGEAIADVTADALWA